MAPGYRAGLVVLAVPIRVGISLDDYYELGGEDHRFGFASVGGTVTLPLVTTTSFGRWEFHGAIEYQRLGETTRTFNGGDTGTAIGSFGVTFAY